MIEDQQAVQYSRIKVAGFGAAGGFVATWAITILMVASEIEIGFPEGTFYTVIGIVLGAHGLNATYLGFALHLLTGTVIGTVSAPSLITFLGRSCINNPYRSVGIGLIVGFISWLVLFLPITLFGVQPAMREIIISVNLTTERIVPAEQIVQMALIILISAIAYHLVYGAIFGYVAGSLIRKKAVNYTSIKKQEQ